MLLNFAFRDSVEGIYLHIRSDGKLFNLSCLKAKTKVHEVLIKEMLFADDEYQACILSTLLYGSESWTTYARQD